MLPVTGRWLANTGPARKLNDHAPYPCARPADTSSTMIRLLASKRPCPAPFNDERTAEESSVIGRVITNFFPPPPHHPEIPRVAPLVARITLPDPLSEHASNPTTQ